MNKGKQEKGKTDKKMKKVQHSQKIITLSMKRSINIRKRNGTKHYFI